MQSEAAVQTLRFRSQVSVTLPSATISWMSWFHNMETHSLLPQKLQKHKKNCSGRNLLRALTASSV